MSKNLGLTFDDARIRGVISVVHRGARDQHDHRADYKYLGEVTNTPAAAVNNGVVVNLKNGLHLDGHRRRRISPA